MLCTGAEVRNPFQQARICVTFCLIEAASRELHVLRSCNGSAVGIPVCPTTAPAQAQPPLQAWRGGWAYSTLLELSASSTPRELLGQIRLKPSCDLLTRDHLTYRPPNRPNHPRHSVLRQWRAERASVEEVAVYCGDLLAEEHAGIA